MDISGDSEFLSDYDPTAYDRPSVTVDLVLLGMHRRRLSALLMQRDQPPQAGALGIARWIRRDRRESRRRRRAGCSAKRWASTAAHVEQLYSFGAVDRDPRMRVITIAYLALLREDQMNAAMRAGRVAVAALEGETVAAIGEDQAALPLAFDHQAILTLARDRLRGKIDYSDLAFAFLPSRFTLRALQDVHEGGARHAAQQARLSPPHARSGPTGGDRHARGRRIASPRRTVHPRQRPLTSPEPTMVYTDIASRTYNHGWRLDPIVRSLLDTDFYKLLMLQLIWRLHRDTQATFALINRTRSVRLAEVIDEGELRAQLDHARTLRLGKKELIWLAGNSFLWQCADVRPRIPRLAQGFPATRI